MENGKRAAHYRKVVRSGNKLSPKQVEELLEVSEPCLRGWREKKLGPPYYREVGRIWYYRDEIEAWRQAAKWG